MSSTFRLEGLALLHCGDWPCLSPSGLTIFWSFHLTLFDIGLDDSGLALSLLSRVGALRSP